MRPDTVFSKKIFAVLLIFGISMAVYYPLLSANVINFDDAQAILDLNNPLINYSFINSFWPDTPSRYYRPLLGFSFFIDSKIWALEYSGYHLTNNLIHTLNAVIVYFIGLILFQRYKTGKEISFLAAIFFALHPLTVESVAWISGRTDILATFFSLLAYLSFISKNRVKKVLAPFMILLGLFCKESAGSMIPIIVMSAFVFTWKENKKWIAALVNVLKWSLILSVPVVVYAYLRFAGFDLVEPQVETVVVSQGNYLEGKSLFSKLWLLPAMIAFYIKKLFVPFPLNFAISTINTLGYSILFLVLLGTNLFLIVKKRFFLPLWMLIFIMAFLPALPIALSDMAWTPYAERYLYLAVPALGFFLGFWFAGSTEKYNFQKRTLILLVLLVFISVVPATIHRIFIWQNRFSLWENTYKKNPENGMVLYQYGVILGDEKGVPYFEKAVEVAEDDEWKDRSLLALARYAGKLKDYQTAVDYTQKALEIVSSRSNIYKGIGIISGLKCNDDFTITEKNQLLVYLYLKAFKLQPHPFDLHNLIHIFERTGDQQNMDKYAQMLLKQFPESRAARAYLKKQSRRSG